MPTVVTHVPRVPLEIADGLAEAGVATVHEAQGRTGLLDCALRPVYRGARIAGSAVTVSVPPADNWTIHVALEQCRAGDVLVASPTSPSSAGYFGELLATSLVVRGARGAVLDGGCRDIAELEELGFPVWSRYINAYGTIKGRLGDVNLPVVCAGQVVDAGDVIVADDDGVVVVPRKRASQILETARARMAKETESRRRYQEGELSLDRHDMRDALADAGLTYVDFAER